ncbi:hypothetical protein P389DRAFT_41780 [Cystobasidium minutum MCA 4210]|uniref:uncharacterized protein n=1 Tax=Cystobasidium minutum MCA 4210 TaxID=1397322 RepID=UPI0034CE20F3|eukprot:jgi/Rhomi1/41780/CE41779_577
MSTPQKKPASDAYGTQHLNAKARIMAQFNQQHNPAATGLATPLGKPRDPTLYSSHAGYKPVQNTTADPDLSGDLAPALVDEINARIEANGRKFEDAMRDSSEGALQSLCAEIFTDMTAVEKGEERIDGLVCKLLKHQVEGVAWLKSREKGKKRGGILADDMGLGKTVQSIALILSNRPTSSSATSATESSQASTKAPSNTSTKSNGKEPKTTLIVAPVALLDQWEKEIKTKTNCFPKLRVLQHHGPNRTKDPHKIMKYDVVLTNYETLRNDLPKSSKKKKHSAKDKLKQKKLAFNSDDESQLGGSKDDEEDDTPGPLLQARFHRAILDEAHTIKNRSTDAATACFQVQAKYRWCLTGTPIQNGVADIFSLFHFMGVQPLSNYAEFKRRIEEPLNRGKTEIAMKRLHYVLASVMLRRRKNMLIEGKPLIELPPRTVQVIKTDFLDPEEREYYMAVQTRVQLEFNKFLKAGSINSEYIAMLTLLLRLRQICNHPDLVHKGNDQEDRESKAITAPASSSVKEKGKLSEDELDDLIGAMQSVGLEAKTCTLCQQAYHPKEKNSKFCISCAAVFKSYADINASTKIIKMLELIKQMREEDPQARIKFVVYQGSMDKKSREVALNAIKEDDSVHVILVSLKAGAQGLNLTCCSTVFIADLWWNPAIENQAIDRAHRMGQTKEVKVYKFVITETVEERILTLQEEKKAIADAALDGGDAKKLNKLSTKDLMYLFNVEHNYEDRRTPAGAPSLPVGRPY